MEIENKEPQNKKQKLIQRKYGCKIGRIENPRYVDPHSSKFYHNNAWFHGYSNLNLPTSIDISGKMPPIYDQGDLQSCTANALVACADYLFNSENEIETSSRLFLYYNERSLTHTVNTDNGSYIHTGMVLENFNFFKK